MFPPSTAATNREAHAFDEGDSRGPGDQQRDARCGQPAAACTCIRHHLHRLSLGSVIPYPPIPHTCQVVKVFASLAPTPGRTDRKSVVSGKSVSVSVDIGGRRILKTKNT